MELNKNNDNNAGDEHQHQQLQGARKRKFNELANDEDQPAEDEDQPEPEVCSSKKNREEGNDLDLELENLSRENLIKLVQKQMTVTMESQKQLETAKKEAEEFSQRIVQVEQEKVEVQEDLRQKITEIEEMHKEMVEKSKQLAEKVKENDALLVQLNGTTSSLTMADLPPSAVGRHRKLPAELNQQIFYCLNLLIRRKFIWALGWDFYAMFRHRLLTKTKRVCNPSGNHWNATTTRATVAADGLNASNQVAGFPNVFAEQPFRISGPHCRVDDFPGTILYYYEVKGQLCNFGLSDCHDLWLGGFSATPSGSHYYQYYYDCWLGGETHRLEGAIRSRMTEYGNVYGCGLVLDPENKLAIFFTSNGKLMGQKIPISPTVDRLFPAVKMLKDVSSIEANFGDPTKSFQYDIKNCPGLGLACI